MALGRRGRSYRNRPASHNVGASGARSVHSIAKYSPRTAKDSDRGGARRPPSRQPVIRAGAHFVRQRQAGQLEQRALDLPCQRIERGWFGPSPNGSAISPAIASSAISVYDTNTDTNGVAMPIESTSPNGSITQYA